jgi:triacylglycerol lipase
MSFRLSALLPTVGGTSERPGILSIFDELHALGETAFMWFNAARYPWQRAEIAERKPVMLIPGFGVGDLSLIALANFCNWLGHRARFVGIVANAGCFSQMIERLETKLDEIFQENNAPVVVIGHSLGGLYARELAHRHPEKIERVITLGSPVSHPLNSCNIALSVMADCIAALSSRWKECLMNSCSCGTALEMHRMPDVPVTAIYSRSDGIVDWKGCIAESDSATLDYVEVNDSHLGMAVSSEVFRIIAERLAWPREESKKALPPEKTSLRLVHGGGPRRPHTGSRKSTPTLHAL